MFPAENKKKILLFKILSFDKYTLQKTKSKQKRSEDIRCKHENFDSGKED